MRLLFIQPFPATGNGFFMAKALNAPIALSEMQRSIYKRHLLLDAVGEEGQAVLLGSRVLVVGAGGLGSAALLYLAACGVGELGIVDSDQVELSNLQRQILHGRGDVGRAKTASARESLLHLRPDDLRLHLFPFRLTAENALDIVASYDFVVEATDNFESKFLVNDVCVRLSKPFCHSGIIETCGQIMTVVPGRSSCYRCVFGDVPPRKAVKDAGEAGILGSLAGVMGALQATEAIKCLLGQGSLLTGRLLTWDAFTMVFREVPLPGKPSCEVCRSAHWT